MENLNQYFPICSHWTRASQRFHSIRPWEEPMCFNFQNSHFILKLLLPLNSFWSYLVSQKNLQQGEKPVEVKEAGHLISLCMVSTSAVVVSSSKSSTRTGGLHCAQLSNSLLPECQYKSPYPFNIPPFPLSEFAFLFEDSPPPCHYKPSTWISQFLSCRSQLPHGPLSPLSFFSAVLAPPLIKLLRSLA